MWRGHSCPRVSSIREFRAPGAVSCLRRATLIAFHWITIVDYSNRRNRCSLALHRLRRHPRFRWPELPLRCLRRFAGVLFPRMASRLTGFRAGGAKALWLQRRTSRDALDQSGVWRSANFFRTFPISKSMPSRCAKATRRCTACHGARARPGSRISTPSTRA